MSLSGTNGFRRQREDVTRLDILISEHLNVTFSFNKKKQLSLSCQHDVNPFSVIGM